MTIAILGISGDVGGQLAKHLVSQGKVIWGLVRTSTASEDVCANKLVNDNLLSISAVTKLIRNSDTTVHAAALLDYKKNTSKDLFMTNALSTAVLVREFKKHCPDKHFLYISTTAVHRITMPEKEIIRISRKIDSFVDSLPSSTVDIPKIEQFIEAIILELKGKYSNVNTYRLTKYLGELFVRKLNNYTIVRISNIFGPGYTKNHTIIRIIHGRLLGFRTIIKETRRSYIYVDNLNRALAWIIDHNEAFIKSNLDLASKKKYSTTYIGNLVTKVTPTDYGSFNIIQGQSEKIISKKTTTKLAPELIRIIDDSNLFQNLIETVTFWRKNIATTIQEPINIDYQKLGARVVKKLKGGSYAHIFLLEDIKSKEKMIQKIALQPGHEGNGKPKLIREIDFYRNLSGTTLQDNYPKMYSYKKNPGEIVYLNLEYIGEGKPLGECFVSNYVSVGELYFLLNNLIDNIISDEYIEKKSSVTRKEKIINVNSYYLKRASDRTKNFLIHYDRIKGSQLEKSRTLRINGQIYKNPVYILEELQKNLKIQNKLTTNYLYPCIHGDLTLLNTVYDSKRKKVFLIDPRGERGVWDLLYDFGKIKFSLSGFVEIMTNSITFENRGKDYILVRGKDKSKFEKCDSMFLDFIDSNNQLKKILFTEPNWKNVILLAEATNFLADAPYRLYTAGNPTSGLITYLIGTVKINQFYDYIKKEIDN